MNLSGKHAYCAGPMRHRDCLGFNEFESATRWLRSQGALVTSPHEIDLDMGWVAVRGYVEQPLEPKFGPLVEGRRVFHSVVMKPDFDFMRAMRRDISELARCDTIVFLPGYEDSAGCDIEWRVAELLQMDVLYLEPVDGQDDQWTVCE